MTEGPGKEFVRWPDALGFTLRAEEPPARGKSTKQRARSAFCPILSLPQDASKRAGALVRWGPLCHHLLVGTRREGRKEARKEGSQGCSQPGPTSADIGVTGQEPKQVNEAEPDTGPPSPLAAI